jgi:hypothetical protein
MPVPSSFEATFAQGRRAPEVHEGVPGANGRECAVRNERMGHKHWTWSTTRDPQPFSPVYHGHQTAINGRRDIGFSHHVYASNRETRLCRVPCEILLTAHFPIIAPPGTPHGAQVARTLAEGSRGDLRQRRQRGTADHCRQHVDVRKIMVEQRFRFPYGAEACYITPIIRFFTPYWRIISWEP